MEKILEFLENLKRGNVFLKMFKKLYTTKNLNIQNVVNWFFHHTMSFWPNAADGEKNSRMNEIPCINKYLFSLFFLYLVYLNSFTKYYYLCIRYMDI